MKKLTDEQISKINEEIMNEEFPDGMQENYIMSYLFTHNTLILISKFFKKYQEEVM